jgi:ABC-type antimicrobial peptide transport system ATPase subunit
VILVRDLIKQFDKRNGKASRRSTYTAVDHLNFNVQKRACFGLLGKVTTFDDELGRWLIDDCVQERTELGKQQRSAC